MVAHGAVVKIFPTQSAAMDALLNGTVDAYAVDTLAAGAIVHLRGLGKQVRTSGSLDNPTIYSYLVGELWTPYFMYM